jgi:hypothetical protein
MGVSLQVPLKPAHHRLADPPVRMNCSDVMRAKRCQDDENNAKESDDNVFSIAIHSAPLLQLRGRLAIAPLGVPRAQVTTLFVPK